MDYHELRKSCQVLQAGFVNDCQEYNLMARATARVARTIHVDV